MPSLFHLQNYAVNNFGQIAGGSVATSQAALFTPGAGITDLGSLGGIFSTGLGLNNAGQVVGMGQRADGLSINASGQIARTSTIKEGTTHTFLLTNGSMQDLGTLGGGYSVVSGMNDAGQVVGAV